VMLVLKLDNDRNLNLCHELQGMFAGHIMTSVILNLCASSSFGYLLTSISLCCINYIKLTPANAGNITDSLQGNK